MRLAFVGQREYFHYTSLQAPAGGVEPTFLHFYPDGPVEPLLRSLHEARPDVVFVWRPELIPEGAFADVEALTIGYHTEPIIRPNGVDHPDLHYRWANLQRTDPRNFDRIVSFDPCVVPTIEQHMPVWRSFPIPVADSYFAPVAPANAQPRVLFTGRSTPHREAFLGHVKKDFDCVHIAHGVTDEELMPFLRRVDIGVNLHNEPYPTFENRVPAYLAAGLLVITEPLSPYHGLLPGRDLLEARSPVELYGLVERIQRLPEVFASVRHSGRRAAERWRASTVYPRVIADLVADVKAFGRGPGRPGTPATFGAT